jgi:ABC-type multidrug transport system ATPase subunit
MAMLKLKDKAKTQSFKLGPSDKRKLCLGIAIIGDPKVVLLDDPTERMDSDSATTALNSIVVSLDFLCILLYF